MKQSIPPTLPVREAFLALVGTGFLTFPPGLTSALAAPEIGPARLIATGWDSPSPARFRAELEAFEAWRVFDGTTLAPTRTLADGRVVDSRNAFSKDPWEWAEFTDCVRDLQAARPKQATHNFLFLYANPGDVDWFDDEGWREVVDHWRLLARVAKQGGLRGLLFDAEPYTPPHSQFRYSAQPRREEHSFAEYCLKARQRGREVMQAVVAEYPDMTLMTYRLFCDLLHDVDLRQPQAFLESHTYGLLPAFVDGWCDVMPPTVRIIEGDEDGYLFNSEADFNRAFTRLKLNAPALVSPENRERFRAQLLIGHGLYLDAHVNPPSSPWYIDRQGGTSAARLAANAAAALAASDGYVWIYGEQGRWWPGGNPAYPLWPEKLAGADRALRWARDPHGLAREVLQEAGPEANLLRNPSFSSTDAANAPAEWWTWQDERSRGNFTVAEGAACLSAMENGVFGQNVGVQPGQSYAVAARLRTEGSGSAGITIGWKTAEGKWLHALRVTLAPSPTADEHGWREVIGLVQVPPPAGQLIFMLGVQGQWRATDRAFFDDVRLVRIP